MHEDMGIISEASDIYFSKEIPLLDKGVKAAN